MGSSSLHGPLKIKRLAGEGENIPLIIIQPIKSPGSLSDDYGVPITSPPELPHPPGQRVGSWWHDYQVYYSTGKLLVVVVVG